MDIERTITTSRSPGEVFDYLADFTTTSEWDPGTVRTTLRSGDGGVGSSYHNVSRFLGRETELIYVVEDLERPLLVRLRGENASVVAHDTMTMTAAAGGGTVVRYRASFRLKGLARLAAPFLRPAFKRLGDEAQRQLGAVLSGTAGRAV
jgi:hypothetical protein